MPKIKELQAVLKKKKIDFALFVDIEFPGLNHDMIYFSGYGDTGVLVVPSDKSPFLVVPRMEFERARKSNVKVYALEKKKRLFEFVKEIVKKNKIKSKRIGVNKEIFTLLFKDALKKQFRGFRLVDIGKELYELREQKTEQEINIIEKGCKISDEILSKCFKEFKKFKTEADVKAFLEYEVNKRGWGLAFPTIVASGKSAIEAHHDTSSKKIEKGFCLIDFGIRYKGYCTDTSRTIYVGNPSKKDIELYELVLKVQTEAIKIARVGVKCSKLYEKAKTELGKYAEYFTHGLGHGIGVKVHELPNLRPDNKKKIKENSIFTIEPGIYLKSLGIRIEDDILVRKNKVEVLTKVPKELIIIK